MRILALILAAIFWLFLTLAIKAKVDFRYRRADEKDHVAITLSALGGLWKFKLTIPTIKLEWEQGPQIEIEQTAGSGTGTVHKAKSKARFRYFYSKFFLRFFPQIPTLVSRFQKVKNQFYRGIHCTALDWRFAIGYKDPMQTALAAGAFWAAGGDSISRLYRQVTMEVEKPYLEVTPQFQKQGFSCDIHCIFKLRIGHIIFAGLNLLRTFLIGRRG